VLGRASFLVQRSAAAAAAATMTYRLSTAIRHRFFHPQHQFDIDVTVVVLPSVLWMNDMMMMMMLCMTGDEEL